MALDEEKRRLEQMIQEFQKEHEIMKCEYEETISAMKMVQQDKEDLQNTTEDLKSLADLEEEKKRILKNMHQAGSQNQFPQSAKNLQVHLNGIEEEKRCLLEEKLEIEERYLLDLLTQQDLAEAEIRLEVSARLEAERRLRLAQDSVHHLEGALENDISPSILRTKILPDVKKLRRFFETVAEEARIDANMPVIMKNAVYARKTLANKARSQILEQTRQENARTLGLNLDDLPSSDAPLKRSLSIMISKKSLKPHLSRTLSTRSRNGKLFPIFFLMISN
ncbi:hypothetical protein C0J52_09779 [Blattella germanica]|nr:hypothetical protein C0J52_09779 [Blattella germanica]